MKAKLVDYNTGELIAFIDTDLALMISTNTIIHQPDGKVYRALSKEVMSEDKVIVWRVESCK